MEPDVEKIENELEQAREDLHQTIEVVNQKVELQFGIASRVRRKPYSALALMAGLGFAAGMSSRSAALSGALIAGTLLGLTMSSDKECES